MKTNGLAILATNSELDELRAAGVEISDSKAHSVLLARSYSGVVKLKRTFTMMGIKFWRVNAPGHPNHESDLSIEGLRDWGII